MCRLSLRSGRYYPPPGMQANHRSRGGGGGRRAVSPASRFAGCLWVSHRTRRSRRAVRGGAGREPSRGGRRTGRAGSGGDAGWADPDGTGGRIGPVAGAALRPGGGRGDRRQRPGGLPTDRPARAGWARTARGVLPARVPAPPPGRPRPHGSAGSRWSSAHKAGVMPVTIASTSSGSGGPKSQSGGSRPMRRITLARPG